MVAPWQILRDGGVPLAAPTSGRRPTADELAAATRATIATAPTGREAEALAAFVIAWHQHWPAAFARSHGDAAAQVLGWARTALVDDDRFLKLRRIALANLADVL